ncbi:hypothetical protein FK513_28115, partial [Klebsiella pneumoniae]|nr:hypothetical protein [Klebsiella pneumoniae]
MITTSICPAWLNSIPARSPILLLSTSTASLPQRPLSLYVHIPFCHKLCYFCGCNKIVTRQQHKADQYLD